MSNKTCKHINAVTGYFIPNNQEYGTLEALCSSPGHAENSSHMIFDSFCRTAAIDAIINWACLVCSFLFQSRLRDD